MTKYSGSIIESVNNKSGVTIDHNKNLYTTLGKKLYVMDDEQLSFLFEFNYQFDINFLNDECWIQNIEDMFSDEKESLLFDFDVKELSNVKIDESINSSTKIIDDNLIGISFRWENRYLFSYHKISKTKKSVKGEYSFIALNEKLIFSRERTSGLYCFDKELNEIWHQDLGGHNYTKANQTPMFDKDLVILNQSNTIRAFNKKTGDAVWISELNQSPGCFSVANGKVYLTERLSIVILNAQTGDLITKEPSGYDEKVLSEFETDAQVGVFPVGDYLYVFSCYHSTLKFLTSDAKKCLQTLEINPTGYNTGDVKNPIIHDNKIYQRIYNLNAKIGVGLLILSPSEEGTNNTIEKQPRLPTRIYAVPSLNTEHTQRVYIEGNKIEDVSRFAGIVINELHYETGLDSMYAERKCSLDRKHNGIIELVVDANIIKNNDKAKSELNELIEVLNENFNEQPAFSGNGKNSIKVTLILQNREEWDEKGDLIDVDKIRNIQISIS